MLSANKTVISLVLLSALVLCSCRETMNEPSAPSGNDSITTNPKDTTEQTKRPDQKRNPDFLYSLASLPEITVTVKEDDWNTYLRNFDNKPDNGEYVLARWRYERDGQVFERDSVGLRPRGNTSRTRPEGNFGETHRKNNTDWHHAHFGIKFTQYATGERFFGSDRVILKWHNNDPMYCREIYCYDLFRRFGVWTAPRACYCKLNIHVEGDDKPAYYGIYELVENPRKGWIHNRYKDGHLPDENGNLWKAAWGATLSEANTSLMGVSDEYNYYTYSLKTNKQSGADAAKKELCDFINGMTPLKSGSSELQNWLEQHIDIDLLLRALAVNVIVGMWDDYWINSNNYYFYFDSDHRFYFIPFDYDNTLGTDGMGIDPARQDMVNWGSRGGDRLLVKKVLSIREYEERYKNYIKQLAGGDFAIAASQQRIQSWHSMIKPYVNNDTGEDCSISDNAAPWGNNFGYKLLSSDNNFFKVKTESIYW